MNETTCLTSLLAIIAVLALPLIGTAQYRVNGQNFNNSYSAMLSSTSTMIQNFTTQQRQYLGSTSRTSSAYSSPPTPAQPAQAQPGLPQYPIAATDFQGAPRRELPPRLVEAMEGVTPQQKNALQNLYYQLLTEYEKTNRKSNIASAVAYAVDVSLEIQRGTAISPAEYNYAVWYYNTALANNPQFNAMTRQQKQILYESSIITGGIVATLYVQGQQQQDVTMVLQARQLAQSVLTQWSSL